jgi:hypothetical protein
MEETITITQKEYKYLKQRARLLTYLESAGVDNWEGYHYAWQEYTEDESFSEDDE